MAFQLNNKNKAISEINVTPLVDVMLVLLVIFMITAPLMLNGIKLELPKTKEVNRINLTTKPMKVSPQCQNYCLRQVLKSNLKYLLKVCVHSKCPQH